MLKDGMLMLKDVMGYDVMVKDGVMKKDGMKKYVMKKDVMGYDVMKKGDVMKKDVMSLLNWWMWVGCGCLVIGVCCVLLYYFGSFYYVNGFCYGLCGCVVVCIDDLFVLGVCELLV